MSGKITPPPPSAAHHCNGLPSAGNYSPATVWTCDDCAKKFVVVRGAQYNESYSAWRPLTEANKDGRDR